MVRKRKRLSIDDLFKIDSSPEVRRLTNGEFDTSDYALSRFGAQQNFLRAIRNLTPEVLEDLQNTSYQIYMGSRLKDYPWRLAPGVWRDIYDNRISSEEPYLITLRESIWDWSRRWNLDTNWCRARAFYTVVRWATPVEVVTYSKEGDATVTRTQADITDWSYGHMSWHANVNLEEFTFTSTWNPLYSSRSSIDKIIRAYFDKQWTEYLDKIEESFFQNNDSRRSLYSPKKEHFNWLVKYQIKCMSAEDILSEEKPKIYSARKEERSISEHTKFIRKAYNKLAKLIHLPLRADGITPGRRPLKKK